MPYSQINSYGRQMTITDKDIAFQALRANTELSIANSQLISKNEVLQHQLAQAKRSKRREVVEDRLVKASNIDAIGVITTYTDGSQNIDVFILNFAWPLTYTPVVCNQWPLAKEYVIVCAGIQTSTGCCFMIEASKLGHSDLLYERLLQNGARFKATISRNRAKQLLSRHFCSPEAMTKNTFILAATSGWDQQCRFHSKETHEPWADSLKKEHLPIFEKSFPRSEPEQGDLNDFIQEFQNIKPWKTRLLLLFYLFFGLFSSLLQQFYDPQSFYLNVMIDGHLSDREIAAFFQIYNRQKLQTTETVLTEKRLREVLERTCDDVLLLDGRSNDGETAYIRQKKNSCIDRVANMVCDKKFLSNGCPIRFALVTLTDEYRRGDHVINLLLNRSSFNMEHHRGLTNRHTMDRVLAGIVTFVEHHSDTVQKLLVHDLAELTDERVVPFVFTQKILSHYFASKGIDLFAALKLKKVVDYGALFDNELEDDDGLIHSFVKIVRAEIKNYRRVELESRAPYVQNAIYYDSNYLEFPVPMLSNLFYYNHRMDLLQRVLRILRKRNLLITDSTKSMVKKRQHENVRCDYYRMPISLFDQKGNISILSLIQEVE